MKAMFRTHAATAALALAGAAAALSSGPAVAQNYQQHPLDAVQGLIEPQYARQRPAEPAQGRIDSMAVSSDAGLSPGARVRLQVHATPGARWMNASLGQGRHFRLREVAPGQYVGSHVVARDERPNPRGAVQVRAAWARQPVMTAFQYPPAFQALAMGAGPGSPEHAHVQGFAMRHRGPIEPGRVLFFRLEGTPHAQAWVHIPHAGRPVALREVRPGIYVGRYVVAMGQTRADFADARAVLRTRNERVAVRLEPERMAQR